ncbi:MULTISPECIES: carboxymuconolactone decarboxylase family protein [Actinomycetes]|uniref:carboxymuconolactone decarboxylase family protein n=2 Tax=Actinomycetes TaxID=1760 RepID=UPI0018E0C34F|nr:carboxymuconolactone decarboxylase family protein [uncultured Rhodococcus sp.]
MSEVSAEGWMSGSENVRFDNTRFDPDLTPFHELAKEMAVQFGYSAELSVDRKLLQLLRLRVAQLNPCSYCLILHTRIAAEIGISSALAAHLISWRESTMFSSAQRAALAYCEGLTLFRHQQFSAVHDELRLHFTELEVAEIAAVIINMNVWTRLKLAQGAVPVT